MALEIITLRKLSETFTNVVSASMTTDLKILSLLTSSNTLLIYNLEPERRAHLTLQDIRSYAWEEDNSVENLYRLLCITTENSLICYTIELSSTRSVDSPKISLFSSMQWSVEANLNSFLASVTGTKSTVPTEILKYELKEAIIVFGWRFVVSFSLAASGDPTIISFADVSENGSPSQQISIVKETIFVLNDCGTQLSAYSVLNNLKVFDLNLMKLKAGGENLTNIVGFVTSLEKDIIVFYTKCFSIYCMALDHMWSSSGCSEASEQISSSYVTVTAFTKHFPSEQRIEDSYQRFSITGLLKPVVLSCDTKDYHLDYIALYNGKLCYLFSNCNGSIAGIQQLGTEASNSYRKFENRAYVVKGNYETFPLLLLHESTLFLILYDIEHDKLVNELMIYHCSGSAEALSSLNNWQNIQIDLEVLKQGLRNRQLDSVEFFLKTHEKKILQLIGQTYIQNLKQEFLMWDGVMELLLETIRSNICVKNAWHFANKLTQITLSFIVGLMNELSSATVSGQTEEIVHELNQASHNFCKYLITLRRILYSDVASKVKETYDFQSEEPYACSPEISTLWKQWNANYSYKEIIMDSISNNSIAMAQSYFLQHKDKSHRKFGDLKEFYSVGLQLVSGYLKQGQLSSVITILQNLGLSIDEELMDIFEHTCERDVREVLLGELRKRDRLTEENEKNVDFALMLERLYPCASFEHAKQLLEEKCSHLEEWRRCAFFDNSEATEELVVGNINEPSSNNCETGSYCSVVLHWISLWDEEVRQKILVPHFLKGFYVSNVVMEPSSVWNYILENGDSPLILKWISYWLECLPMHSSDEFPYGWQLTESMINTIKELAPVHVAESALNELARYGVFCEDELEDISLFLSRVGKAACDIDNPSIFLSNKATISFTDLCHRLVHYCLKHDLIHYLYQFLIKHCHRFISWPTCQLCNVPLLRTIKGFCSWLQNPKDCSVAYRAMLTTAEHVFRIPQLTLDKMFTHIPFPLNIAMLLFGSCPLKEAIQNSKADLSSVKRALLAHPLLYDSLFKSNEERLRPSVSVYQLLQSNIPFDSSRLFGWQSMNTIKNEDAFSELPHFCMPQLSEQYGLKETLSYYFYLMQGRPNFAYLKFIAQELGSENQISLSRVRATCKQVSDYALSNFTEEKICSACIVFVEMLGQDSLPLRTCLMNANFLFEKLASNDSTFRDKIFQEISFLFKAANDDKEIAKKVVKLVETETVKMWQLSHTESVLENITLWMPVMALSHLYGINAGEQYLCHCAEEKSWLNYLVFSQIFQLPRELVLKCLGKFSNPCIGNHLDKALRKKISPMPVDHMSSKDETQIYRERDLRRSLYSRIGVTKDYSKCYEGGTSPEVDEDTISICSVDTTTSSDPDTGPVVVMEDLLSQLLYAHCSDVPWISLLRASIVLHHPILSLLAASYPDAELLHCFATWLATIVSTNQHILDIENLQNVITLWTESDIEALIVQALKEKKLLLLQQGISIFLARSPLLSLVEFLVSFFVYKKLDSSVEKFKAFQNELSNYAEEEDSQSPLHSLRWLESISIAVLKVSLLSCNSSYERNIFLRHLAFTRIEKSFVATEIVPAFSKVYQMLQYFSTDDPADVELFLLPSSPAYTAACWKSVKQMLGKQLYNESRMFAKIAGLSADEAFLLQVEQEAKNVKNSSDWNCLSNQIDFWRRVMISMRERNMNFSTLIDFFKAQCDAVLRSGEKCILTQLLIECYGTLDDSHIHVKEICTLVTEMWYWCMKEVENGLSTEDIDVLLSFKECDIHPKFHGNSHITLTSKVEEESVEKIINHLLMRKNLNKALEVSKVFNYVCQSLKIILLCLKVAKGEAEPQGIEIDESNEYQSPSHRRKSVVAWTSVSKHGPSSSEMQIIHFLEKLCEQSTIAAPMCNRILVNFTVAAVLNCSYEEASREEDPFVIIKKTLSSRYKEKFSLAKSIITVHKLKDDSVASFLCQIIQSSIASIPKSAVMLPENYLAPVNSEEDIIYNPSVGNEWFQLTSKLCQDSSLLGRKLMDVLSQRALDAEISPNKCTFFNIVELCICAHDCFTEACDVEGIAQVLHKSQKIITSLAEGKEFSLMVRLFTGIGRYSEMSYVFDVLQEHEYFELLFEKKMKTVPQLKLALLDYLKRCPSKNADNYYNMLALKFCMHREIAELLEMTARKRVLKLCKRTSDLGLQNELQYTMQELTDASESYCKAECYMQGQMCAQLAKLVALQLFLLPTGTWIVGLDEASVSRCIIEMKEFSQALIVAEAYKHNQSWSQAVFHNVIVKGNWNYLTELQMYYGLSESLFEDVAKSFHMSASKNEAQLKNIRELLSKCKNVTIKYELVKFLGFHDIAEELCMGESGAYIQDLLATNFKNL